MNDGAAVALTAHITGLLDSDQLTAEEAQDCLTNAIGDSKHAPSDGVERQPKRPKRCPDCGSTMRQVRLPEGGDDETQGDACTHPWHDR